MSYLKRMKEVFEKGMRIFFGREIRRAEEMEVNEEHKDLKEWADRISKDSKGEDCEHVVAIQLRRDHCNRCGKLLEDVPLIVWSGEPLRVYSPKIILYRDRLVVAANGTRAIRAVFEDEVPGDIERYSKKKLERFARAIRLDDSREIYNMKELK